MALMTDKPLGGLSAQEQRALVITFVGGFGSIIAGAAVLGGALALARFALRHHLNFDYLAQLTLFVFMVVYTMVCSVGYFWWRHRSPLGRGTTIVIAGIPVAAFAVLALMWIGIAAGVR